MPIRIVGIQRRQQTSRNEGVQWLLDGIGHRKEAGMEWGSRRRLRSSRQILGMGDCDHDVVWSGNG